MHIFNKPLSEIDFNKILSIKCAVTPEVALLRQSTYCHRKN